MATLWFLWSVCLYLCLCQKYECYIVERHNQTHHLTVYGEAEPHVHSEAHIGHAHAHSKDGGTAHAIVNDDHSISHAISADGKHGSVTFTHKVNGVIFTFTHRWKRAIERFFRYLTGRGKDKALDHENGD